MGHGAETHEPPPVTPAQMRAARIPVTDRDECAGLLINLNKCRRETFFMPWQCHHDRHEYEHCLYNDWKSRHDEKMRLNKEAGN